MKKFIFNLLPYYLTILGGQKVCKSESYKVVTLLFSTYYLSYYQPTTVSYDIFINRWNVLKINHLQRL